jgi:cytoskeleton protein RodZ
MSADWNVETVTDSKPEAPPEKPSEVATPAIPSTRSSDQSLGKVVAMAREARGFSREQAATASNIPGYYLTMIETDDYSSIADQLYLLPFLRRYATFVGLDAEEVASRFIRDVQRADMNPVRVSDPISIISPRKELPWGIVARTAAAIIVVAIAWFGYRHFTRKAPIPESEAPAAAEQAATKTAVSAPAKVAPAPVPSVAVAPRMAPAPVAAAAPKSGLAGSPAARPRVPVKSH